ncbi:MAG TPA: hypothetical protein DDX68_14035, partial [Clostridium sp.]|nr:hypothetical protein [Clostridium sp.]
DEVILLRSAVSEAYAVVTVSCDIFPETIAAVSNQAITLFRRCTFFCAPFILYPPIHFYLKLKSIDKPEAVFSIYSVYLLLVTVWLYFPGFKKISL